MKEMIQHCLEMVLDEKLWQYRMDVGLCLELQQDMLCLEKEKPAWFLRMVEDKWNLNKKKRKKKNVGRYGARRN